MPLILAIEPDRRQAAHLAALARGPLRAELVFADTTEGAIRTLGERVPDLILTSAFLSPKDEDALADRLRALDAAAAHIQTLTIPVLAAPTRRSRKSLGMLDRLRRPRVAAAAPEGCDPSVFAEQIAEYLRAAAERKEIEIEKSAAVTAVEQDVYAPEVVAEPRWPVVVAREPAPAVEPEPSPQPSLALDDLIMLGEAPPEAPALPPEPVLAAEPTVTVEPGVAVEPVLTVEPNFAAEPIVAVEPVVPLEPVFTEPVFAMEPIVAADSIADIKPVATSEPVAAAELFAALDSIETIEPSPLFVSAEPSVEQELKPLVETAPAAEAPLEISAEELDLRAFLAELEAATVATDGDAEPDVVPLFLIDPVEIDPVAAAPVAEEMTGQVEAIAQAFEDPVLTGPTTESEFDTIAGVELWMALPGEAHRWWPPLEGVAAEAPLVDSEPEPQPALESLQPEWLDMLEALRRDIERLHPEPAMAAPPSKAPASVSEQAIAAKPLVEHAQPAARRKKHKKAPAPIQDEWGFFDPERCGFAALVAKLDEVADAEDETPMKWPA